MIFPFNGATIQP